MINAIFHFSFFSQSVLYCLKSLGYILFAFDNKSVFNTTFGVLLVRLPTEKQTILLLVLKHRQSIFYFPCF